jgi:hypothetical protein
MTKTFGDQIMRHSIEMWNGDGLELNRDSFMLDENIVTFAFGSVTVGNYNCVYNHSFATHSRNGKNFVEYFVFPLLPPISELKPETALLLLQANGDNVVGKWSTDQDGQCYWSGEVLIGDDDDPENMTEEQYCYLVNFLLEEVFQMMPLLF